MATWETNETPLEEVVSFVILRFPPHEEELSCVYIHTHIQNRIECKRVVRLRVRVVGAAGAGDEAAGAGSGGCGCG